MGLCCMLTDVLKSPWGVGVLVALLVIVASRLLLSPSARRAPTRPPRDAAKRKHPRGTGQQMKCVAPATGEELGTINAYTPEDVKQAYEAARVAACEGGAQAWGRTSFEERRAVLQDIIDWIVDHQPEIIEMSVRDSGKTVTEASMGEVMISCEKLRWLIAHGERCLAREGRPVAALLAFTKKAYVEYKPLGVIGVIVPWNYPFHNVISAVGAALMAGNGALVKVSEYASFGAGRIEQVLREILARRGHDPELVQIVTGYGETGSALVSSGVDKVLFIGSPAVGKLVMRAASATLTPVILELGGKDPFIVFDDVDFDHCVDIAIRGAFINCGQNCISAERFYVQAGVYDKFVAEVKKRLAKLELGASSIAGARCDFGAITMAQQVNVFSKLIKDAVSKGATLEMGGEAYSDAARTGKGCFFRPTVLSGVTHAMEIANEEAFGPVMSIIKFSTEEEVIKMANCTQYGLGSSVFTTDYTKAERVTSQLVTGMTTVNDFGMVPMVQSLPFGGVKHSGFGAFNGAEGLRGFSRTHAVVTDRFPMRTQTPKFLQYPVSKNAINVVQAGVRMIWGRGWIASAKALVDMLGHIAKA